MQDYFDSEFWDLVYDEYGVTDELDILSANFENLIQPSPGIIILLTRDYDDHN